MRKCLLLLLVVGALLTACSKEMAVKPLKASRYNNVTDSVQTTIGGSGGEDRPKPTTGG